MRHNFRVFATAVAAAGLACLVSLHAAQAACTTQITDAAGLQNMQNDLAGSYCLANDINAGPSFTPIGSDVAPFTGTFDGRGHAIRNLRITSSDNRVGLFAATNNAVIRDVRLINARIIGTGFSAVGGVVSVLDIGNGSSTILRVHVSGLVRCTGDNCGAGGLVGGTTFGGTGVIRDSSSAASVTARSAAGGIVGNLFNASINRTYATGAVQCTASPCNAGGLVGKASVNAEIDMSFATGSVTTTDGDDSRAGGLIGSTASGTTITHSFALGQVTGGATPAGYTAGLIGQHNSGGAISQTYAAGMVTSSGAGTGGLFADVGGTPSITRSFWDTQTTGQMTSGAGVARVTNQLRAQLPNGYDSAWGITKTRSYPFLVNSNINFIAPLATLVRFSKLFTFLPISQLEASEYLTPPENAERASLAAVYTMIARAVGITWNDTDLINAEIDKYFWDDATSTTTWQGPVEVYAQRGPNTAIAAATPLDSTNVIGRMDTQRLVILRGSYTRSNGATARHWMLGTLYRQNPDDSVMAVLANDPLTGKQVSIDPMTKRVIAPADFPLTDFTVDLYQPVTLLAPL